LLPSFLLLRMCSAFAKGCTFAYVKVRTEVDGIDPRVAKLELATLYRDHVAHDKMMRAARRLATDWFAWERGGTLLEEARHFPQWNQTMSLLWFKNEEVPSAAAQRRPESRWSYDGRDTPYRRVEEDESGLKELDGQLRFPGRRGGR
jgi:hypothetical protein